MNLDFLKDVKVEEIKKAAPTSRAKVVKLPTDADLRVFSNGSVYPSEAFAEKHNLEYQARVEEDGKLVTPGNGVDMFPSTAWQMLGELPQKVLFGCIVPKNEAKVDLFASTRYEDDGAPKASVLTQGSATYGKNILLPAIADVYGVDWDETDFVDLKMVEDMPIVSPNGVYIIPKVISTGAKKGEPTYIRRENLNVCPFVIAESQEDSVPNSAETTSEDTPAEPDSAEDPATKGKGWSKSAMESKAKEEASA